MSGNTLNIRGLVKSGNVVITDGYVRAINTNKPSNVDVVRIGSFEDGTPEAGRYDVWFKVQSGEPDVFAVGDVFRLSLHNLEADANAGTNPVYPAKNLLPVTQEQFDLSLINYELQAAINSLPELPVIVASDNLQYTNNSDGVVNWTWVIPSDPEQDNVHFQLEWTNDQLFQHGIRHYTTNPKDDRVNDQSPSDRQFFSYEQAPGASWISFPSTGVTKNEYGKKCRFRTVLPSDGTYYWRVRATDDVDR